MRETRRRAGAQEVRGNKSIGGHRERVRRQTCQRGDAPQLTATTQDSQRARHRGRVRSQAREPAERRVEHLPRHKLAHPFGARRCRRDRLGAHRGQQLAQQERVASRDLRAHIDEPPLRQAGARTHDLPHGTAAQRRGPQDPRAVVRLQVRKQPRVRGRLARPNRHDQAHRQLVEAVREIRQRAQGRLIGPVRVIDRQYKRRRLGQVADQPEEPVQQRQLAIAAHARRRSLQQRPHQLRRTREAVVFGRSSGANSCRATPNGKSRSSSKPCPDSARIDRARACRSAIPTRPCPSESLAPL